MLQHVGNDFFIRGACPALILIKRACLLQTCRQMLLPLNERALRIHSSFELVVQGNGGAAQSEY